LSSRLTKKRRIKIYKTVILPAVLYGYETWSLTLGEEHRLRIFENRVLRRVRGEGRGIYKVCVGRPEGNRPLGRSRRRWKDNIKLDLLGIWIDGANWIRLAQDRVQWWVFVSTVINLRVP
jgi:hypothetical protein